MNNKIRKTLCLLLLLILSGSLATPTSATTKAKAEKECTFNTETGLDWEIAKEVPVDYAEHFQILCFENGYQLLALSDGTSYLLVPEGKKVPKELDTDIRILPQNFRRAYLANTAAMSYFAELEALDTLAFSSVEAEKWQIADAREAMESGDLIFAGKYREPDYELLTAEACDLVFYGLGIQKYTDVLAMLENLEIPYFIDLSSSESHPLGRVEWIKVYGAMLDKAEAAEAFFEEQVAAVETIEADTEKKVSIAFFNFGKNGEVYTRHSDDYIARMIELAGASYVPEDTSGFGTESVLLKLEMESFYLMTKDADIILYNGTTYGPPPSLRALLEMNPLLEDFRAVKNNAVYTTDNKWYQETSKIATMIEEIHLIINTEQAEELKLEFITHLPQVDEELPSLD